jgi:hypothetical protein
MKVLSLSSLQRTAARRPEGYLQDVLSHASVEGDVVTMPREAYLSLVRKYRSPNSAKRVAVPPKPTQLPPAPSGPGTELKALLKDWLGIQASPNCSCNARARQMDEWGPDLCEQNLPTIVDWLGEQAAARKLPFVRFAAEQAVKLAIRRARKKAAR